jgi:acylphosphatase
MNMEKEMKRANITIKGNVQMVGFRTFIKNIADLLNLKGFVENLENGSVKIVCEGERDKIDALVDSIKENPPSFATIEELNVAYEEYKGEFVNFERKGVDVPREESEMLTVMKSFDKKADKAVTILGSMDRRLGSIEGKQDQMLGKHDQTISEMRTFRKESGEKQDQMLEKHDQTISVIKEFREDTMQRFDTLDTKYGKIAENMEKAIDAINRTCTNTERLLEKTERDREDFRGAIEKLANAILSKKSS